MGPWNPTLRKEAEAFRALVCMRAPTYDSRVTSQQLEIVRAIEEELRSSGRQRRFTVVSAVREKSTIRIAACVRSDQVGDHRPSGRRLARAPEKTRLIRKQRISRALTIPQL